MLTTTIDIPYRGRAKVFHLYFLGDVHLGSSNCDEPKLYKTIDEIRRDENALVFLMGDLCDFISRRDWRFRADNIAAWVEPDDLGNSQADKAVELFNPIAKKIIGVLQGNHEDVMEQEYDNAVHRHICKELGVPSFGYSAFVRLNFVWRRGEKKLGGDWNKLDVLLHHGFGGGRTDGADVNKLTAMQRDYACDLLVAGHTHRIGAYKSIQHYINTHGLLDTRIRIVARSGTFLKTLSEGTHHSYSERAGMSPLNTGALVVTYCPYRQEMTANI